MSDLVERLRAKDRKIEGVPGKFVADVRVSEFLINPDGPDAADEIEKLREVLGDIAEPLAALRRDAEAKGLRLSGMAYSIANDPEHLKRLARQALQGIEK